MKLLRLPRTILFGALAFGVLLAIVAVSWSQGQGKAQADDVGDIIDVCCAWNSELIDGDLTYSIAGGDEAVQAVVAAAVEEWESTVPGLTLTPTNDTSVANVEIKFRRGGGVIQGVARRKFDDAGLVREVDLSISGKAFGDPNNAEIVAQITKHEFAHALGPNHANFSGDLLSTTVTAGVGTISDCDVNAVLAANDWYFGGSGVPAAPSVNHVHCGPAPTPGPEPTPGDVEFVTVESIACAVSGNRLIYTVTIVDPVSDPVPGAIVTGTRLDPRGRLFNFEGETNAEGQVSFRAGRPARGDHLITVQDVTGVDIDFVGPVSETCTV